MIDVKIDLNKSLHSFSNRVKVRQGDVGEKMRITLTDNKSSLENQNNLQVKFEGNVQSGDYVEGIANQYNEDAGKFIYQFKSEDVSITGPYQRAFIRVYDENGNKISSEEIFVEVLKDADISNAQATVYVSKLDSLVENLDEEFDHFLTGKKEDYSILDKKNNELDLKLVELQKGTNKIEQTQTEILQSIDEHELVTKNELEVAKEESSVNVIYQLIGKEKVRMTLNIDLNNKVAGSLVENPSAASFVASSNFLTPSQFIADSYINYPALYSLDESIQRTSNSQDTKFGQIGLFFNVLEIFKRELGENFFIKQGATTIDQQVAIIKKLGVEVAYHIWGYGSNPLGNKLTTAWWLDDKAYSVGRAGNGSNQVRDVTSKLDRGNFPRAISKDGYLYVVAYGEPSDGTTGSTLYLDYASVAITIDISANDFLESMVAANHVENIATQEEAESGTNNTKTMTPLLVNEVIDKKAVTLTGNQTIGGIKNLKDGLLVEEDAVVGINDHSLFVMNSENTTNISTGAAYFVKHGSIVIATGSIKFKNAISFGNVISNTLPAEFSSSISNGIIVGHTGSNTAKAMYAEKGTTNIKANNDFAVNEWFTFSGTYWTGEDE